MKSVLCSLAIFSLAAQMSATSYEEAKEALTTLEKLRAEKLLSEDEYQKQRQAIIVSIGGLEKKGHPSEKPPHPSTTFEHRFFKANFKKLTLLKNGEIEVVLDIVKPPGDFDAVLRLNDTTTARPQNEEEAIREFQALPILLTSSDGVDYRLVNISGIGYFSTSSQPDPLSTNRPTSATFRFRRVGHDPSAAVANFSLIAELCVFVRSEGSTAWTHEGRVGIRFDGLK